MTCERYQVIREILNRPDIRENEKQIFRWKFFGSMPLSAWTGTEQLPGVIQF